MRRFLKTGLFLLFCAASLTGCGTPIVKLTPLPPITDKVRPLLDCPPAPSRPPDDSLQSAAAIALNVFDESLEACKRNLADIGRILEEYKVITPK